MGFSFYCCCKLFSISPSTTLDPRFLMDSLTSQTFIVKQFEPPSCSLLRTLTDALVKPCMCLKWATETLCGLEELESNILSTSKRFEGRPLSLPRAWLPLRPLLLSEQQRDQLKVQMYVSGPVFRPDMPPLVQFPQIVLSSRCTACRDVPS